VVNKQKFVILFVLLLFVLNGSGLVLAASEPVRHALVIGNGAYQVGPLKNPVNDSRDMRDLLQDLGFKVTHLENANLSALSDAVYKFGRDLKRDKGLGFFYYAGHGMQVQGRNYLIPVGARIRAEYQIQANSFDVGQVLGALDEAENRVNIVILDACRDNPFARSFRSGAKGLAQVDDLLNGTLIAYATAPGRTALDGEGRNSPYTRALLKYLKEPGSSISRVFQKVRCEVLKSTNDQQNPWEATSLTDEVILVAGGSAFDPTAAGGGFTEPVTGMEFVRVPAGCFQMGSSASEAGRDDDEGPVHKVCVDGFFMGKYEVTLRQWRRFIKDSGYRTDAEFYDREEKMSYVLHKRSDGKWGWDWVAGRDWDNPGFKQQEDNPVCCVSYNDVEKFISWFNRKSSRTYRLPTEAEWEYACRAETSTSCFWGDDSVKACDYANTADQTWSSGGTHFGHLHECRDGYFYPAPVGKFRANGFGLYNMLGNVCEWCSDLYDKDYYKNSPVLNPQCTSSGSKRVIRGGSWKDYIGSTRSTARDARRDMSSAHIYVVESASTVSEIAWILSLGTSELVNWNSDILKNGSRGKIKADMKLKYYSRNDRFHSDILGFRLVASGGEPFTGMLAQVEGTSGESYSPRSNSESYDNSWFSGSFAGLNFIVVGLSLVFLFGAGFILLRMRKR